ncbi:MAG: hypothetical protein FWC64_12550 [Treponema sp.]|nr:hypothetical protein [Treponema sp.]
MGKIFPPFGLLLPLLFLVSIAGTGQLWARDVPTRQIEDDSSLRRSLEPAWFRETPASVLARPPEIHTLRGGGRVQVRTETSAQNPHEFAVVLARERGGAFPGWAQGSWVLTRRHDENHHQNSRIRIFLRSDFNTYVQFRPLSGERSQMDVVLYDAYILRSLPVPISFESLLVLPVENALTAAGSRFPRRYFDPEPGRYRDVRAFVASVRSKLPELTFVDDGAIDENGRFVFIESGLPQDVSARPGGVNCSGFTKWIVDGILRPVTGQRLPVRPLAEPFGDRGGASIEHWEALRDPFFGLDWIRNLAARAGTVLRSPSFANLEEIEVRNAPFSQLIHRQGGSRSVRPYRGFLHNAGFCIEGIHPLLYTLAIDEPGWIFLAAVNDELGNPDAPYYDLRGLPRLRQFYHVAVLVPFFTEDGVFQVVVFESGAETSFARFRTRYPDHFVSLVRVPVEGRFSP